MMNKRSELHEHRSRGFSLIETLVAISILTSAITGPLYLAYLGIRSSRDAENELVATHLAAEALEIVQARRNAIAATTETLDSTDWFAQIYSRCDTANGCAVDVTEIVNGGPEADMVSNNAIVECPNATCVSGSRVYTNVYFHDTNKVFRQGDFNASGQYSPTPYARKVTMSYVPGPGASRQARVTSTVTYTRANGTIGTVQVSTDLYNWFPEL
jgi:prepilin-type N-terminal cleavage/methylation domain-containing protein